MRITGIKAYRVELPLHEGRYNWSNDNSVSVFDSTVVEVETDTGLKGYGECCPLGSAYLPAYAEGVRAGLREIGGKLIGLDPLRLDLLDRRMDEALRGHPYVKAPLDIACFDLLGKAAGLPAHILLGGGETADIDLYRAISQESPDEMAREGRRLPRRGLHEVPAQGRRRSGCRHRAHRGLPRGARQWRGARRRRQYRLDHARGGARRRRGARSRRLYRAALPRL